MHQEHANADPAFEYTQIDEGVYIGTNACCQMHFEQVLLRAGVSADISLEGEMVDRPVGVRTYLWLPTHDHAAPSHENVLVGVAALRQLLANGQKVYIHCKNGHGRAPTFYAAYLILEKGSSVDEALGHITAKRPSAHLEDGQIDFLRTLVG